MSRAYRNSSDVPLDAIIKRLHELSDAVVGGRKTQAQEFVMRVPAECDHDADLVLAEAAVRLDALRKHNAELQDENDNLRKANQDCVAWEKACKADLDRALANVETGKDEWFFRGACATLAMFDPKGTEYHDAVIQLGGYRILFDVAEDYDREHLLVAAKWNEGEGLAARLRQQADQQERSND